MRTFPLCVVVLVGILAIGLQGQQQLDNQAIIKLHNAGLSDDTILNVINKQPGQYSTGVGDIIALKQAGISEQIIQALLNRSNPPPSPTPSADNEGPNGRVVLGWQYVKNDDPLHSQVHDRFSLEGVYLTPPRVGTRAPTIVVECSGGKVENNYFNVGAVVDYHAGGIFPDVNGFEVRVDGKKKRLLVNGVSTDGQAMYFTRVDLKTVLNAKQVIVGANEYLGPQVVMRFDMPDPSPVMEKCGSDRNLTPRDRWGRPIKKDE